jgi:hypothetical protein
MTTTGQSTRILADRAWAAYHRSLIQTVANSIDPATQAVTLVEKAETADFGNTDPAIAAGYVFETGNTLLAWDPRTTPPEGLLYSYAAFLDNIDLGEVGDPDMRSQLDAARSKYRVANKNFADVRSQAIAAWIESRQTEPPVHFASFVKGRFPLFTLAALALRGADIEFESLMFQAYGTRYSAIADARNKCGMSTGAAAMDRPTPYNMAVKRCAQSMIPAAGNSFREEILPICSTRPVPTFAPVYRLDGFAEAFTEWRENSEDGITAETLRLTGNSNEDLRNYPWPPSGGKTPGDFFKIGEKESPLFPGLRVNTRGPDFSVTIDFAGLDTFSVAPGAWFDRGIVEAYRRTASHAAPRFFREGASTGLLPIAVIVGFAPSIVITMDRHDYVSFKARYHALPNSLFTIGPFRIGGASDPVFDSTRIGFDDRRSAVTIRPRKKTLPLVLGVVSSKV